MTAVVGQKFQPSSPVVKQRDEEEDDFEKELASFIESEEKQRNEKETSEVINNNNEEKGEKDKREKEGEKASSEVDQDYVFTSDQQRAMDELLAQREEEDFIGEEEPPEYNVKDRLLLLNAELANDPTPLDNSHRDVRIKFKDNLIDLVAPPPDFSDEEEEMVQLSSLSEPKNKIEENNSETVDTTGSPSNQEKDKKFVIERDGKFEVLQANEMTSTERILYNVDAEKTDSAKKQTKTSTSKKSVSSPRMNSYNKTKTGNSNNNSTVKNTTKQPCPPSNPRPVTASTTRRNVRPATATNNATSTSPASPRLRPRSAAVPLSNSSPLENFSYHSPYALSDSDKTLVKQHAIQTEEKKKKDKEENKKQEEEKQQELESIFQSWLLKKKEDDMQKRREEIEKKNSEKKEDKNHPGELQKSSSKESIETNKQTEENQEMFNSWMKNKEIQRKNEKLLKKRQEQEMQEGCVVHNKSDCEKTFKRWLRKKNAETHRKNTIERQKVRYLRLIARKSRKSQALARAIHQSQSYKYVDYNY